MKLPTVDQLLQAKFYLLSAYDQANLSFWFRNSAIPTDADFHRRQALEQFSKAAEQIGYTLTPIVIEAKEPVDVE
jgi:hypothetical protein